MFIRIFTLAAIGAAWIAGPANATTWIYDGEITVCNVAICSLVPVVVGDPVTGTITIDVGVNDSFVLPPGFAGFDFLVGGVVPVVPVSGDPPEGVNLSGSGTTDADGNFASGILNGTFVGGTLGPLNGTVIIDVSTGGMEVSVFSGSTFVATVEGTFTRVSPIGGSVAGMFGFLGRCINENTGQSVSITLGGATTWDCTDAGLSTSPGDSILQVGAGPVNCAGCSQTGNIFGVDGVFAACRNLTTAQLIAIPLAGGTSWNCTSAGLLVSPGDVVLQITRGTVPPNVSYAIDVQPILGAKCASCHTGLGVGGHNIGTDYLDAFLTANHPSCAGLNVGQCTIVRIQSGQMPQGAGCTGDPALDIGNASCLTQSEQDTLQAWIDQGLPE